MHQQRLRWKSGERCAEARLLARLSAVPLLIALSLGANGGEPAGAPYHDLGGRAIIPCLEAHADALADHAQGDRQGLRDFAHLAYWFVFAELLLADRRGLAAMSEPERERYYDERRLACHDVLRASRDWAPQ